MSLLLLNLLMIIEYGILKMKRILEAKIWLPNGTNVYHTQRVNTFAFYVMMTFMLRPLWKK